MTKKPTASDKFANSLNAKNDLIRATHPELFGDVAAPTPSSDTEETPVDTSGFWERFNAMATAAETTETGKLFVDANFRVGHNGGGTSSWERPVDETGWKVMITDSEGFSHDLEEGDFWIVGAHHDNGEFMERCVEARTVAEAIAAADAFHVALTGKQEAGTDIVQTINLAREFGSLIQAELTPVQFREMCDRNKAEAENAVCHSHDFCDANVYMLEAFRTVMTRDPAFILDANHAQSMADLNTWNQAWAIAKAADFFA